MKNFPMMCQCPDGATRIAKDHLQMSAFMGAPYGEDGKPIVDPEPEPEYLQVGDDALTMVSASMDSAEPVKNKGGRPRKNPEPAKE